MVPTVFVLFCARWSTVALLCQTPMSSSARHKTACSCFRCSCSCFCLRHFSCLSCVAAVFLSKAQDRLQLLPLLMFLLLLKAFFLPLLCRRCLGRLCLLLYTLCMISRQFCFLLCHLDCPPCRF